MTEPTDSPEQAVIRSEHRAHLEEGLGVLTERERTALLLRDVEGLPAELVAEQMNCSKATVRSHIANARIKFRRYLERSRQDFGKEAVMKHPSEMQLALLAGGDLPAWERWRMRRHVSGCADCGGALEALRMATSQVRELAAEMPKDVNWNRLADEMTGNIRVGLAAGQAIARFDKPLAVRRPRLAWNAGTVVACATLLFVCAFWASIPRPQAEHLVEALKRIAVHGGGNAVQQAGLQSGRRGSGGLLCRH